MEQPEIAAARDDVLRSRARISETVEQIEERLTAPVTAAKERLNVVQLVRDHPWPALAVAAGLGALLSSTGADTKVASATVAGARKAGTATVSGARRAASATASGARRAGSATVDAARETPARATGAVRGLFDGLAASLVTRVIGSLRESRGVPGNPTAQQSRASADLGATEPGASL